MLAIVCALYIETQNWHNDVVRWILGIREQNGINFFSSSGSQIEITISPPGNEKEMSFSGRELLMSFWYYYPLTVIRRSKFWVEMFKHEEIIKEMQEDAMKKWKSGQW